MNRNEPDVGLLGEPVWQSILDYGKALAWVPLAGTPLQVVLEV